MEGYSWVLVLAAIIQVISSHSSPPFLQNLPDNCKRPPRVEKPHECCKVPPFFEASEITDCGFGDWTDQDFKPGHDGPHDCTKQVCLLKKHDLVKDDNTVNFENVNKYLDEYVVKNPDFKPAIEKAKECVTADVHGPPHICLPERMVHCIAVTMMTECPITQWQETDGCKALRDHMDECKSFFIRKN